jgi:hypothetical protein
MTVSLSGLDLSFLRKNDPAASQPGRYRFDPEEGVIPAALHARKHRPADRRSDLPTPYFMPDVDAAYGGAWKSIIDGSEISSRSNWREHNKRNDVVDVGDKFWGNGAADDRDEVQITVDKMGYDPSLIGRSAEFDFVDAKVEA